MQEPMVERQELQQIPKGPILETEISVSYLGVRLPKAENRDSQFVPKKEAYADYINDKFSLEMQQKLATAFSLGQPILIEGGTSIGKTTTGRKMASDLGWEVHYVNLNGATDVEDLMGRYIPNPNRRYPEDPEYIFADGKVTSGLRQEEGKVKLVILDEFNSANPNIVIRIHEVLDELERGGQVVLSEDASETIAINKSKTKIVAFTNPPGKGYIGREPLDKAQLRRWTYYKAPSELPDDTASHFTKAIFGLAPQIEDVPDEAYLFSRDSALLPEQLPEIPGMLDILERYDEFHKAAKQLLKGRQIAADQPQQFTFDDRNEKIRVRNFILNFYNGDISQTMQAALRYYYSNKLESEIDRAKLDELIAHVEYIPPIQGTQRRPLETSEGPVPLPSPESTTSLIRKEQIDWGEVLGVFPEVKALPGYVTPEVRRNIEKAGMSLRYIPALDLSPGDDSSLEIIDIQQYLKTLNTRYPNWKPYEKLTDEQKADPKVVRNLNEWYWQQVKDKKVDFPWLPGYWIAVENMPKPAWGEKYQKNAISTILEMDDRFNVTWKKATETIENKKTEILNALGLEDGDPDLLDAMEWNLLANREGWGATDTWEWTQDEYRGSGGSRRLVVGRSAYGGAARVHWGPPDDSNGVLGFRVAVVLR